MTSSREKDTGRFCMDCGKQLIAPDGSITLTVGGVICGVCAEDLDKNGLYPDEHTAAERMHYRYNGKEG